MFSLSVAGVVFVWVFVSCFFVGVVVLGCGSDGGAGACAVVTVVVSGGMITLLARIAIVYPVVAFVIVVFSRVVVGRGGIIFSPSSSDLVFSMGGRDYGQDSKMSGSTSDKLKG